MKVLTFDITGDYGHFRKFYTTSSPLTFSFPPPPTIRGMLGAIYGSSKEEYLKVFSHERCYIGLRILKEVKKTRIGINLINTKDNFWRPIQKGAHEPRTQIRTEFIKNPTYRIYFSHQDGEVFENLAYLLKEHKSIFTFSLGLSELLGDFKFEGIFNAVKGEEKYEEIVTIIPFSLLTSEGLLFEEGKKYFKERIPVEMIPERKVQKYDDILYESQGKTIKAQLNNYYMLENGDNIAFI